MISTGDLQCTPCHTDNGGDAKENNSKRQKTTNDNDKPEVDKEDMAWICGECKEAECGLVGDSSDKFLICDGPCKKVFHIPCAGMSQAPTGDDDWFCQDCSRKEHACAYCSEYGADFVDVFPCKDNDCGLFFHEACLRLHHVDYKYAPAPAKSGNAAAISSDDDEDDEDDEQNRIPIFSCHAHQCWTCTQKDMIQLEKNERALAQKSNNKKSARKKRKKNTSIFQCKPGRLYVSYRKRKVNVIIVCEWIFMKYSTPFQ